MTVLVHRFRMLEGVIVFVTGSSFKAGALCWPCLIITGHNFTKLAQMMHILNIDVLDKLEAMCVGYHII